MINTEQFSSFGSYQQVNIYNPILDEGKKRMSIDRSTQRRFKQYRINEICRALNQHHIHNETDLRENMNTILDKINRNSRIFKNYDAKECFEIFKKAVHNYQKIKESLDPSIIIPLNHKTWMLFESILGTMRSTFASSASQIDEDDTILHITRNYDRFEKSVQRIKESSDNIEKMIQSQEYAVIPHVIIGLGDAATTLWLEKYQEHHQKSSESISKGKLPDMLMIGSDLGNWKHDYVLAQPHNLLERGKVKSNPKDFIAQEKYQTNPYVNARHMYQSNLINLADTEAPILQKASVLSIEKKENHIQGWQSEKHQYRLKIKTSNLQEKYVYVDELDICCGLGKGRKDYPRDYMDPACFEKLSRYDSEREFTPLVDGDQYILTKSEEQAQQKRTIVLFGGGGTATATYRKAFFGHDRCLSEYSEDKRKNEVFWISSDGFDKAGVGTLAKTAIANAQKRNAIFCGMLKEITYDAQSKKLIIHFNLNPNGTYNGYTIENKVDLDANLIKSEDNGFKVECDQFIYSVGQNPDANRRLCEEIKDEVELDVDSQIPLGMKSKDEKIRFIGTAAQVIGGRVYSDAMRAWISKNAINEDSAAAAVMPPSRAMIKMRAIKNGAALHYVNVNVDDPILISRLLESQGIGAEKIKPFIVDIIKNRKSTESGMTNQRLQELLKNHHLSEYLNVTGHNLISRMV